MDLDETPRRSIPYTEVAPVFAVDVSWSTRGRILEQEQRAVADLTALLSPSKRSEAWVIPWSSTVHQPIAALEVHEIRSSAGTVPAVLMKEHAQCRLLQQSKLWFLLTDGEIGSVNLQNFAFGIANRGLHGKASVTILFGSRPRRPLSCNISVGQAVFAVTPDCAFLFYDVDTEELFIFQCKGCFRGILEGAASQIILDKSTSWKDLPRTTFAQLAKVAVPEPRALNANTILLSNGHPVDLEDLYSNRLSSTAVAEILDNDDNLKSVLLVAQSRRRSDDIERWLSGQKEARKVTKDSDRPDVDGKALELIGRLTTAMRAETPDPTLEKSIRKQLRDAHLRNWTSFLRSMKSTAEVSAQRFTVVNDALSRVQLSRDSPSSPAMLSPVSPGGSRRRPVVPLDPWATPAQSYRVEQRNSYASPPPAPVPLNPPRNGRLESVGLLNPESHPASFLTYGSQPQISTSDADSLHLDTSAMPSPHGPYRPVPFPSNSELSRLLYMKSYKLGMGTLATQAFCGKCGLCEDESSPLALLLKAQPSDCETEGGFPEPGSHQRIIYPLAMGSFPETDIVSSFLCCEKCAHFVRILGHSPVDDEIKGLVPLVPIQTDNNRELKLREIDSALDGRFDLSILDQVFLSMLYQKLDDITTENPLETRLLSKALAWEATNFATQILLKDDLASLEVNGSGGANSLLAQTLSQLRIMDTGGPCSLVEYPVDGFVTLLKGTFARNPTLASEDVVKRAMFQRFVFHLAEQQSMMREAVGVVNATEALRQVLAGQTGGLDQSRFCAEVEALEDTYLFEPDAMESFRRLRTVFSHIERDCGPAIRLFLQLMADLPWKDGPAVEMLNLAKAACKGTRLFSNPWELQELESREILQRVV